MHNQPVFWNLLPDTHTNAQRYGHRFLTERLALGDRDEAPDAIKAWEGMELYHIDAQFMLNQLERIRKEAANMVDDVRKKVNKENTVPEKSN